MLRYSLSDKKPVRPKRLVFGILSSEEIKNVSVCHVESTTLYYRGLPASGGLLDPLMGSVDRRHLCATCIRDACSCQGHSGHIELAFPMYHIGFFETVLKTLRTLCFFCSRVCCTEDDLHSLEGIQGRSKLLSMHAMLRTKKVCPHCEATRPTYNKLSLGIRVEWPPCMEWESEEETEYCTAPFTARDALSILSNMIDSDVRMLGFNPDMSHPRNMIVQNLLVPPPSTRPAIYSSEGSRSRGQNDLTIRLVEVLKRSHEIKAYMQGSNWSEIKVDSDLIERINRLQYEVFILVNSNGKLQRPPGMGRIPGNTTTVKSLTDRIKGKEGRVRGNLMGKRVDFSARCVITPDAYFDCDRVGVPYRIAIKLTIPERVNTWNINALTKRVRCGGNNVLGAENVITCNGVTINLITCKDRSTIMLHVGDIVERYLADDDIVVFNRQPSLHMHGMQAHRVRLMPGHTFRLSLIVAAPYNADFDGDEMNIHVPQSHAATAECAILMGVAQNCISGQANRPVMGVVQDALLGMYMLTNPSTILDHPHMCRIACTIQNGALSIPQPALVVHLYKKRKSYWTGKQVFSLLLPSRLYMEPVFHKEEEWDDKKLPIVIVRGSLLCGVLTKAHIGTSSGGVVDVLCREFGGVACMRFMGDVQRIAHEFNLQRGINVGIDDVMLSKEGQTRVNERLQTVERLCGEIQKEAHDLSPDSKDVAESTIMRLLSKMLLQTGGIVNEHMGEQNAIRRMVTAGSKGSFINLSQICACLGQQSIEGGRIMAEKETRTLPCFSKDDPTLLSKGMVFNSFALGLSPPELFYHAIGGREGLVDTAVKTSQTGYMQRRMNKSMEDHTVCADGIVRNAASEIISFVYGSDGMNPTRLERVKMPILTESIHRLRKRFVVDNNALQEVLQLRSVVLSTKTHIFVTDFDNRVLLPFNPERIKREMIRMRSRTGSACDNLFREKMKTLDNRVSSVVRLSLFDMFSGVCLEETDFYAMFKKVKLSIDAAMSIQGESVGCIAAQSIGEPCTQMTLNTFHTAGCGSKNVTMGIPRLRELMDSSKQQGHHAPQ